MPISVTQTLSFDAVIGDLHSLAVWRYHLLRFCLYGGQPGSVTPQPASTTLRWSQEQATKGIVDIHDAEKISAAYKDMVSVAQFMLQQAEARQPLSVQNLDMFESRYIVFTGEIMAFERKQVAGPTGTEALMNLRPMREMRNDLKREQDRFDRKGAPFSLAAIEVDRLRDLAGMYTPEQLEMIFVHIGVMIAGLIRSFDDAYYLGNGAYLIALKQIEFIDACSVMDRLRSQIESSEVTLSSGERVKVTASLGVCEAMAKESVDVCLHNARLALEEAKEKGGNRVSERHELSSLARYAKETHKD